MLIKSNGVVFHNGIPRNESGPGSVVFLLLSMHRAWAAFNCLIWGFCVMG